ncbi:MAG: DUF2461 domain-containing protein, partial [Tannerellaceae bacterium]|nr:DUF2461 domain-containing protein [Tannerellaceae bacterium]
MKTNRNKEILQFLKELTANNNREWFHANKERYDVLKKAFEEQVKELINLITLFDPEIAGLEVKDCTYRIYRDIRFSPDKRPYKAYMGAYIAKGGGRKSEYGGYYVHLEPDNCLLSGGIYMPDPKLLKKLRQDIYNQADEFMGIMEIPVFKKTYGPLESEMMLSRVPAGFPSDTPYAEILKHKNFTVCAYKPDSFFEKEDWMNEAVADFRTLQPFNR